jgi:spore coat polysaccharide biosynthesis protein SpsF (cytidylyltransferase family)
MLKIGAIVQARMSSQRLPGKVLQEVKGKPILQYIIERLEHCCTIKEFVIATSRERSDNQIEEFCSKKHVPCYRGSLNDVAGRFKEILEKERWDAFVRVNGDSPLIDQHLIDNGVNLFIDGNFDLVTNVFPRTYPSGQSIEIVRANTFKEIYSQMNDSDDFEHVTNFFYRNPKEFKIINFTSLTDYSSVHLSVDTLQDMQVFSGIIKRMTRPHWDYHVEEVLVMYREICTD